MRLTGRGGFVLVFATCFFGLLVAELASWEELAGAVFFMASSLAAYYVRRGGLLSLVVSTPLLFFFACLLEKVLTSAGPRPTLDGTGQVLSGAATWLLAGTGLTVAIALLRGLPGEVRALALALRATSAARAEAGTPSAP